MLNLLKKMRHSFVFKVILAVGTTLLLCLSVWGFFNINDQKEKVMRSVMQGADRLTNTIRLGTHYAMMHNLREDINRIIKNIGKEKDVEHIRIYNKGGQIKFSNHNVEIGRITNIKAEACYICHKTEPPMIHLDLSERTRVFSSPDGGRLLGIIAPIYSEPGCSSNSCHAHLPGQKVLGALDVVVSLKETDQETWTYGKWLAVNIAFIFLMTSAVILLIVLRFVRRPIKKMVNGTRLIAKGEYLGKIAVDQDDELGQLATAIEKMGEQIDEKRKKLNKQKDEYQNLFDIVPCIITVQDRNYKLLRYNREFAEKFNPDPGDYCYHAYKGRKERCEICPVERTFEDGLTHFSEETGVDKNGKPTRWIVSTSPIKNDEGEIVAAMEMSVDITHRRLLEEELDKSEKKYFAIFDNIPNPVFVLDVNTLEILDCNESVQVVYGYTKDEIIKKSFLELFADQAKGKYASILRTSSVMNQAKHINKKGEQLFVNIRISPSEYPGRKVLLVTTSDITKRLETEQQLIQASKMATLGEMATGVAHELNQPLTVIKTAGSYLMKKVSKHETIDDDILFTMAQEIDTYVDRAVKIINHMREFGRKTDIVLEQVQVNKVLKRAFEILGQQLKTRGIEVVWDLEPDLPMILADSGRLEQVIINLLLNARDALDGKWKSPEHDKDKKKIELITRSEKKSVVVTISDTGSGIPEAYVDKIFDPFFTTKEVGHGTGLGLSISYGIIQECDGSIQAVRNETGGASFIIKFPIPKEQ
ncbi:MAG: PAS domain S-box protein [Desulfobacterales bacterium]|uniref:histidine kinase n=1 Tax=Candidatus Desulfatibia vada TaxID=2841696 RepID=A0A8J6NU14_9BACT|nr:PAS domain S-box protein [Candidatus Desulfatibia vada]